MGSYPMHWPVYLPRWVDISRQKAKFIDPHAEPYDVLLDAYEKGMTSARLDAIFEEVRLGLVCACVCMWGSTCARARVCTRYW